MAKNPNLSSQLNLRIIPAAILVNGISVKDKNLTQTQDLSGKIVALLDRVGEECCSRDKRLAHNAFCTLLQYQLELHTAQRLNFMPEHSEITRLSLIFRHVKS